VFCSVLVLFAFVLFERASSARDSSHARARGSLARSPLSSLERFEARRRTTPLPRSAALHAPHARAARPRQAVPVLMEWNGMEWNAIYCPHQVIPVLVMATLRAGVLAALPRISCRRAP